MKPLSFLLFAIASLGLASQGPEAIAWRDLPPAIQQRLERSGLIADAFPAWVADRRTEHAARVLEGDEDHLVFYALQSRRFTTLPPIEPALSARELLGALDQRELDRFLADPSTLPASLIPDSARARLQALVRATEDASNDARLAYFRTLLRSTSSQSAADARRDVTRRVERAYLRAMRFLAEQDVAARDGRGAAGVATLYRTRGLSTDTSVEAGFLVREGLATLKALEPTRRVTRVVIVGPGYDLAARTGYQDALPPQSLQPFAVIDALVSLGLSQLETLRVTCLDINPRVVAAIEASQRTGARMTIASGLRGRSDVTPTEDFARYVDTLGLAIAAQPSPETPPYRVVAVSSKAVDTLAPRPADLVLDRLALDADLVIVTNVLPYLDDRELALALTNIHAMLAPNGVLLHNEARPEVGEITAAIGLPLRQARTAMIAAVRGASPLYDSAFIHVKK